MIGRASPSSRRTKMKATTMPERDDRRRDHRGIAMDRAFEARDDQPERRRAEHRAEDVEILAVRLGLGQMAAEQRARRGAKGTAAANTQGQEPNARTMPPSVGASASRARDDHAVDAEPAAQLLGRIDGAQHRRGDAERRRRAERLGRADDEQEGQALGEEAERVAMVKTSWPSW